MNDDEIDAAYAASQIGRKKYGRRGDDDAPPDTWRGDETRIANRYKRIHWEYAGTAAIMAPAAYFLDLKYVVAIGFALLILTVSALDARTYDIAVRLRRAVLVLRDLRDR
jgi:hypothetical protein